ncbi:hypothetical protein EG329_002293 [Mollisiaceae sp. DMI_Dod_QoI]|nr:hypothetical protein EG329_002293 [Helotiales sp. DMI_Dod_QoI]
MARKRGKNRTVDSRTRTGTATQKKRTPALGKASGLEPCKPLSLRTKRFLQRREDGTRSLDEIPPLFTLTEYTVRGLALETIDRDGRPITFSWTDSELFILEKLVNEDRLSRFGDRAVQVDKFSNKEKSILEDLISAGTLERQVDGNLRMTHLEDLLTDYDDDDDDDNSTPRTPEPGASPKRLDTITQKNKRLYSDVVKKVSFAQPLVKADSNEQIPITTIKSETTSGIGPVGNLQQADTAAKEDSPTQISAEADGEEEISEITISRPSLDTRPASDVQLAVAVKDNSLTQASTELDGSGTPFQTSESKPAAGINSGDDLQLTDDVEDDSITQVSTKADANEGTLKTVALESAPARSIAGASQLANSMDTAVIASSPKAASPVHALVEDCLDAKTIDTAKPRVVGDETTANDQISQPMEVEEKHDDKVALNGTVREREDVPDAELGQAREVQDNVQSRSTKKSKKREKKPKRMTASELRVDKNGSARKAFSSLDKLRNLAQTLDATEDRYLVFIAYHQNVCIGLRYLEQLERETFTNQRREGLRDWRHHFREVVWIAYNFVNTCSGESADQINKLEELLSDEERSTLEKEKQDLLTSIRVHNKVPWAEYLFLESAKEQISPLVWCLLCYQIRSSVFQIRGLRLRKGIYYDPAKIPVSSTDPWGRLTRYTFEPGHCVNIPPFYPAEGENLYLQDCIAATEEGRLSLLSSGNLRRYLDNARNPETTQEIRVLLDRYLNYLYGFPYLQWIIEYC